MKRILVSMLLLVLVFTSKATKNHEFSSVFISEKFQVYNALMHYKIWSVFDFLILNKEKFRINRNDIEALKQAKNDILPVDYLFREEEHWIIKAYRSIPFYSIEGHQSNSEQHLKKFTSNILTSIPKDSRLYSSGNLENRLALEDLSQDELESINEVVCKEDWVYNKVTGGLDFLTVAVGFAIKTKDSREYIFWLPFSQYENWAANDPSLKKLNPIIKYKEGYSTLFYTHLDDMNGMINIHDRAFTYHNALITINEIENFLKQTELLNKDGAFEYQHPLLGKVKGEVFEGHLHGTVKHFDVEGNLNLELNYKNGVLNGEMKWFWDNGKIREKARFEEGYREGAQVCYFSNGIQSAKRFFIGGVMEGEQREFHSNGSPAVIYHFSNGQLNESYTLYDDKGNVLQKGSFHNGIMHDDWEFTITVPAVLKIIISKNTTFFNQKFTFVNQWKAQDFMQPQLKAKAHIHLDFRADCLNGICNALELKPSTK